MSMNAVALLKIAPETLREALRPSGGEEMPEVIDRGGGLSFRIRALDDATLVLPTLGFDLEPDEIAAGLKKCLGGVIAAHRDAKGVLVFPDKATPSSKTYDGVVEEIGELGMWVSLTAKPKPAQKPQPAPQPASAPVAAAPTPQPAGSGASPFAGFEDQIRTLMNALPPEALSQIQQAVMSGDPSQMAAMETQLQAMMGQSQLAALQESLMGALAGGDEGMGQEPSEEQMEALLAQAQEQMDALQKNDPALFEQLQKQFGGAAGAPEAEPTEEGSKPPSEKK